ncbi:MAG: damage-control phosphatase ARMT1 family protein [Verrucomicrobiales bacterium]|nr:ARMT1-like domain-containing protein [Verrucomicrobiota bacterium JB025]
MKANFDCVSCLVRQATEALELSVEDPRRKSRLLRWMLRNMVDGNWEVSPPLLAGRLHRKIREEAGVADPYQVIKERMNERAQEMLPRCRELIAEGHDSREVAARIAVAGNHLDSGSRIRMGGDGIGNLLEFVDEVPLVGDVGVMFREAEEAERILYLTDNAGEIVFDRLLIEQLPMEKVTVAVRGAPVLNDALLADAEKAGIDRLVRVISNGSDMPGTVLEECSAEFREHFEAADLILAKGQGNFETLSEVAAPLWFLFAVKCDLVAHEAGAEMGDLIVNRSLVWRARNQDAASERNLADA